MNLSNSSCGYVSENKMTFIWTILLKSIEKWEVQSTNNADAIANVYIAVQISKYILKIEPDTNIFCRHYISLLTNIMFTNTKVNNECCPKVLI